MDITIKNVQHNERLSEETHCFSATVYIDGKKQFGVKNAGHGGCDDYYEVKGGTKRVHERVSDIDMELGKEKCAPPYEDLNNCLEIVIGDLVNDWLTTREIKKAMRKIQYLKGGEVWGVKLEPTPQNIERIKRQTWWKDEYKILNGLPLEKVKQYYV